MNEVATLETPYDLILIPVITYLITPLAIIVPFSFPFESTIAIPWNHEFTIYIYMDRK